MAAEREGRLLATMLNMLVAGISDPARLSRGRTYAMQGAVEDMEVLPGVLRAAVQGGRPMPYSVVVRVDPAESFENRSDLVPGRRNVRFSCSCPDGNDPCKHGVAVMVAFAEHVADAPSALGLWRGQPQPGSGPRAVVGSRGGGTAATAAEPAEPSFSQEALAALREFLGEPVELQLEPVSAIAPPVAAWGELWAEMLTDALHTLTDEVSRPVIR
ncbi:MAG: hypothetical protein JWL72_1284 [Ilumatobacteraceae bacterium]|nr:hypothetical protein [Ilumatobacteraceae bacterium]MCU1387946.1 hypothetical protein [Ilumatobacteraceae bacterium]